MSSAFLLFFFLSFVGLVIGLINPKLIGQIIKRILSRKKITLIFGSLSLLFFVLTGVTAGSPTKVEPIQVKTEQETQATSLNTPQSSPIPSLTQAPLLTPTKSEEIVKVILVIDGDTIEIEGGQRVRYIGIDTPETVDPRTIVQCFGKEASDKNKELVLGKNIRLEKDVSETDKYGRLLRYVYVGDMFVNDYLVRQGYAHASSYPPDINYQNQFSKAQEEAKNNKSGLWSDNTCGEGSTKSTYQTPVITTQPKTTTSSLCKYSCSGPDKDCSDFSTHAEAQAFFNCCGFSASFDPMRLDKATGQGNGLACESLP